MKAASKMLWLLGVVLPLCWCLASTNATQTQAVALLAAGDIAMCNSGGDEETAKLLDNLGGTILTLGDNVYPTGHKSNYRDCYAPSWGRHKNRTVAVIGNHDYSAGKARDYFAFFGAAAGPNPRGYHAFVYGTWRIIVLNSNCWHALGCRRGSPQYNWLQNELRVAKNRCTLLAWHHPRFSSGLHGNNDFMQDIWDLLANSSVDVVLAGHDHHYERFARLSASGQPDAGGLRSFVVGTGGAKTYPVLRKQTGSQERILGRWGVLRLGLGATGYTWRFVTTDGESLDAGQDDCR